MQEGPAPAPLPLKHGYEAPVRVHRCIYCSALTYACGKWWRSKRSVICSLCEQNTGPFQAALGTWLLLLRSQPSARAAQGALYASRKPPCWAGFATGTGEPGRAGGASEVPKPRLEWGQAPAPPRAVLGALSPSTSSSFSAENPGKCHKQAVCARALGRRGAGRATAGLWSGGGAKCCVTGGNSSGVAVTRAGSWPSTSS